MVGARLGWGSDSGGSWGLGSFSSGALRWVPSYGSGRNSSWGSGWGRAAAAAGLALGLWPTAAAADINETGTNKVWLPFVVSTARREACGPAHFDPCPPAGSLPALTTHCGGMGRIRDLVAQVRTDEILAIGDGAATITLGARGREWSVRAQHWAENGPSEVERRDALGIVGLNGLFVLPSCRSGAGRCGWAVGERAQILEMAEDGSVGSCWHRHDNWPVDNTGIELNSIFALSPSGRNPVGWIVGRDGDRAEIMVLSSSGATPVWERETGFETGGTPIPPLFDVQTLDGANAIALGHDGRSGVFADLELVGIDMDRVRAEVTDVIDGLPEQIALTPDGGPIGSAILGWAFGRTDASGSRTRIWEHAGDSWIQSMPDRDQVLIDAFSTRAFGQWFGLIARNPGDGVLFSLVGEGLSVEWEERMRSGGEWGGPAPGADPDGHLAILPLDSNRVVYAAGDEVWLADVAAERWSHLQTRRRLIGFAPDGRGGGWALSADAAGSRLFELPSTGSGGLIDSVADTAASNALPKLSAIASGGGRTWAVGPDGESWRPLGALAAWRRHHPPEEGPFAKASDDFLDVDVTLSGVAWAAGVGADGHGRLWRWVDGASAWAEVARLAKPETLLGVTAVDDGGGRAIAVGGESILVALPDDECGPGAKHWNGPAGWMCTESITFDLPAGSLGLHDIDAASATSVWAVGRDHLVRLKSGGTVNDPTAWRADSPPGMPAGGHPLAVAVLDEFEGIVVHSCCDGFMPDARRPSNVRRFRSAEGDALQAVGPAAVINVPLADAAVDRRAGEAPRVWLTGDWTTLIEAAY